MFSRWLLFVCWSTFGLPTLHVAQSQNNTTMLTHLTVCIVLCCICIVSSQQSPCRVFIHQLSGQDVSFLMEHQNSLLCIEESDTACALSYNSLVNTITLYFTKVYFKTNFPF